MKKAVLILIFSVFFLAQAFACGDSSCYCRFWNIGFGGPMTTFSNIKGKTAVLIGGAGGWSLSRHFSIGGGGYSLISPQIINDERFGGGPLSFDLGYGGLMVDIHSDAKSRLGLHLNTLLGMGGYGLEKTGDAFWVAEPAAKVSVKVAEFLRISAGVGYRWANTFSDRTFVGSDLSNMTVIYT